MTNTEIFQTMKLEIYNLEQMAEGYEKQYWKVKDGMDAVAMENKAMAFKYCAASMKAAVTEMERVCRIERENRRAAMNHDKA